MIETDEDFSNSAMAKTAVTLGVMLVLGFGVYALYVAKNDKSEKTIENFLTAKGSAKVMSIGWSLFATAMGSWVITGPSEYGFFGGILGVISYAFASSMPIMLLAFFGRLVRQAYPDLLSLSDFILWRFGRMTQGLVVVVTILNMSIASIAEYTTLSSLYSDFVGLKDFTPFMILLIAGVTLTYSAYGGLSASIATDKIQAIAALSMVMVLAIYLAVDFNKDDIRSENPNATFELNSGLNAAGYSGMFILPFSLATATIFSEALWQRSWAAEDDNTLMKGSWIGCSLIFIVVGFFGLMGLIVSWANLVADPFTFDSNLYAFQAFSKESGETAISSGVGIIILLLATTMAEGALDSLQNGIAASITGVLARFFADEDSHLALKSGRFVLVICNIPYIFIGLQQYSVLSLFLIGNMMCVCAFFPIMLGFFKTSPFHPYFRDFIPPTAFVATIILTMIFSGIYFDGESFGDGINYAFWNNIFYEYEYFLAALIASMTSTFTLLYFVKVVSTKTLDTDGSGVIPPEQGSKVDAGEVKNTSRQHVSV